MKKKDIFEQFLQDSCDCRHITAAVANSLRKVGGPTLLEDRILMVDDTSSSMSSTILSPKTCSPRETGLSLCS